MKVGYNNDAVRYTAINCPPTHHFTFRHTIKLIKIKKSAFFLIWATVFVSESDFLLAIITFISCLVLPLEVGILIGIGINLLFILYHAARPKISIETLRVGNKYHQSLSPTNRDFLFYLTDSWRCRLLDPHPRPVLDLPLDRLCEKPSHQTEPKTKHPRGDRLFAHLRRWLYSGNGGWFNHQRFCQPKSTFVLLQSETFGKRHVRGFVAAGLCGLLRSRPAGRSVTEKER